jgi:hypothetical protein
MPKVLGLFASDLFIGFAINAPQIANNPPAKPTTAPRATKRIISEKFMATAGTSS